MLLLTSAFLWPLLMPSYRLEVRLPRTWLALVEEIAWNYEEETVDSVMEVTIKAATNAAIQSSNVHSRKLETPRLEEFFDHLDLPDTTVSRDLLSPVPSRDPSPRRLRPKSKSPARWKLLKSISDAIQDVMNSQAHGVYGGFLFFLSLALLIILPIVPTLKDPRPGRFVRQLDFNHFRTIGMRRSVEEGVNSRFVTGDRVQAVLMVLIFRRHLMSLLTLFQETPNLIAFGATEYMDGALTLPVLNELFLRGVPSGGRGRPTRGRALVEYHDIEEEDRERRGECKDLEAVDLTGCVSAVFVNAFTEFVNTHLVPPAEMDSSSDEEDVRRSRRAERSALYEPLLFPGLQRLGMRGVKSILPKYLGPFLLAFPSLTHLDLSGTRVTPEILNSLGESSTLHLKSLALARCIKLTSESIKSFLVHSQAASELTELNLYGDMTYVSPLTEEDLVEIVTLAPCFLSGELVYLDVSSAPITGELLQVVRPQSKLRSLGLSHIPNLHLKAVTNFIKDKAPNVEILTVINTSPELDCGLRPTSDPKSSARRSSVALHTQLIRPLCLSPSSFSLTSPSSDIKPPPSRLRVVELSMAMLSGLGAGAGAWRIIRSKGGRGWYVDTASGWTAEAGSAGKWSVLRRDLPPDHPFRIELEKLSNANGNVSSGVGWHARKMEVCILFYFFQSSFIDGSFFFLKGPTRSWHAWARRWLVWRGVFCLSRIKHFLNLDQESIRNTIKAAQVAP